MAEYERKKLAQQETEMAIGDFDVLRTVFPVCDRDKVRDGVAHVRQVIGSSFAIGGGFFVTAAHVLKNSNSLGFPADKRWLSKPILRAEINEGYDIGVFECQVEADLLTWSGEQLPMTAPVLTVGFPYALNPDLGTLAVRAFTGSIVAMPQTSRIPARPRIYELQFPCPRGLSGAPLVFRNGGQFELVGMIVGNATTEVLVLQDREVLSDGTNHVIEKYETLQLGIALQTVEVLDLPFDLLGKTLREHLGAHACIQAKRTP
jgi:hypothetical protein